MGNKSLRVEHLAKQYRLGQVGTGTISHDLNRFWHRVRGKEDPYLLVTETNQRESKGGGDYVWALNNVSFELEQGDVLGIIGKNGAGKSTLLKILSKITAPTKGRILLNGRMASLLEVGTGFHPELTGKENIFLNGAILGMRKDEVARKLDEIVEFSGCAKYLDTPVKRYSSGMIVRLGFAVAAHLESEILVVDEVLAVGDQDFQNKCIGKMKDISGSGRTVLFVSHNISSVRNLCNKGLVLTNGSTAFFGGINEAISRYLNSGDDFNSSQNDLTHFKERIGTQIMRFNEVSVLVNGRPSANCMIGDSVTFTMLVHSSANVRFRMALQIYSYEEIFIANIENSDSSFEMDPFIGEKRISVSFNDLRLYPGKYKIGLWLGDKTSEEALDYLKYCIGIEVLPGSEKVKRVLPKNRGFYFFTPDWKYT